eukprot:977768-Prymnesium_polylepis.1
MSEAGTSADDACAIFREAVTASTHHSSECRELAAQLFWRVAQLCHHGRAGAATAALEPEAVSHVCALLTDVSPAVRSRACLLLASLPNVPAGRLAQITNKQPPA